VLGGLANADGTARRDAYGTYGTPTAWFDGEESVTGGANAYAAYRARIDAHLAVDSPLTVTATADFGSADVTVTIRAALEAGASLPDDPARYALRVILYEEEVTYCCDTLGGDVFRNIGRAVSAGQPLTLAGGAGFAPVVETLPIDPAWGRDLAVVAFVEHDSGAILTTSGAEGTTALASSSWGRLKSAFR